MRLVAAAADPSCDGEVAPRGVSLAVKGPPWLPIDDHFDREVSLSQYDLEQLASAGVNLIRLGAMMPGVLPDPPVNGVYRPDGKYIERLKTFVQRAASYGMYTLIEFHQDVISQHLCGEGLPRWAADEVRAAFPAEFEDEILGLLHRLTLDLPGLDHLEDAALRDVIRRNVGRAEFPMPISEPFKVQEGPRVYRRSDCDQFEWYQYQLSFAAGHAYKRLFNLTSSTFQHVFAYWQILARAFRGNPNVVAFDLFNEPHPGNFLTEPWIISPENADKRLSPFYSKIAHAIHDIDPDRLVTFSPVTWEEGGYYLKAMNGPASQMCDWLRSLVPGLPLYGCETFWDVTRWMPASGLEMSAFNAAPLPGQSILSFHFYTPPELNHEAYARKRKSDAQRLQVYPLLSETCCLQDSDALQRLFWFEHAKIGWVMWEYKHMGNGTWNGDEWVDDFGAMITGTGPSMFHTDGTPIKEHWRRLAHPSAQYVRGEVLANIFDFTVGTFNLTFIPSPDCRAPGPDAVINWPWTWWSYINITSLPRINVSPPGIAEVSELVEGPEGFATPVVRFGVHALRKDEPITVTLSFVNFKNIDLIPEEEEPSVFGPWYQGLAWPVLLGLVVLVHLVVSYKCCVRCLGCCSVVPAGDLPPSRCGESGVGVTARDATGAATDREQCRNLFVWARIKAHCMASAKDESEHLLRPLTPPGRSPRAPMLEELEPEPEMDQDASDLEAAVKLVGGGGSPSRPVPRVPPRASSEEACFFPTAGTLDPLLPKSPVTTARSTLATDRTEALLLGEAEAGGESRSERLGASAAQTPVEKDQGLPAEDLLLFGLGAQEGEGGL